MAMAAPRSDPTSSLPYLPDECLALIFQSLPHHHDLANCSLVSRRWLRVEGPARRRLSLTLSIHRHPSIPSSIFIRFPSLTDLSLTGKANGGSLPNTIVNDDEALIRISLRCTNLTRLTLRACRLTPRALSNTRPRFFEGLEQLHLHQVDGITQPIIAAASSSSLKLICLDDIPNFDVRFFAPLIEASKSLTTLKLVSIQYPPLDTLLRSVPDTVTEIHMEHVVVRDAELSAISSCCPNLQTLRLVDFFGDGTNATNAGIAIVAQGCKSLRKLHVDDYRIYRYRRRSFGDQGLIPVAENCPDLEELVLGGVRVTKSSLGVLGDHCAKLERLSLCGCITVGDDELMCVAAKCNALKKLWIENCPVSDRGIQALASGCPNLVKVMFRECTSVSLEGVRRLRASRASLVVDFDEVGRGKSKAPAW